MATQTSYNDVCNKLREICESHLNVALFRIGPPSDIEIQTATENVSRYPYVHLVPEPGEIIKGGVTYNFQMVVMDLAKDTEDREQRTHNNTLNVLMDIIAKIRMTQWDDVDINVNLPITITPFVESYKHSVAGWTADIQIESANPLNLCESAFAS